MPLRPATTCRHYFTVAERPGLDHPGVARPPKAAGVMPCDSRRLHSGRNHRIPRFFIEHHQLGAKAGAIRSRQDAAPKAQEYVVQGRTTMLPTFRSTSRSACKALPAPVSHISVISRLRSPEPVGCFYETKPGAVREDLGKSRSRCVSRSPTPADRNPGPQLS